MQPTKKLKCKQAFAQMFVSKGTRKLVRKAGNNTNKLMQ